MIVFVFDERRHHFGFQNLNNASLVFWATPRRRVTGVDVAAAAGAAMVAASGVVVVTWLHFFFVENGGTSIYYYIRDL